MARTRLRAAGMLLFAGAVSAAWALGVHGGLGQSAAVPERTRSGASLGSAASHPPAPPQIGRMVHIAGGTFRMGSDLSPETGQHHTAGGLERCAVEKLSGQRQRPPLAAVSGCDHRHKLAYREHRSQVGETVRSFARAGTGRNIGR